MDSRRPWERLPTTDAELHTETGSLYPQIEPHFSETLQSSIELPRHVTVIGFPMPDPETGISGDRALTGVTLARSVPGGFEKALWWDRFAFFPHPVCNTISIALSISVLFLSALLICTTLSGAPPRSPLAHAGVGRFRSVDADIGAVAADDKRCSAVGTDILKAGGNAVDGAVAVALCLGVCNPMASGLGGGGFTLIRMADGRAELIDSRETAPAAAYQEMYASDPKLAETGGLAVGVPGELKGLEVAWQRFGHLGWAQLLQPAIRLAEGARVSAYLAESIQESGPQILTHAELAKIFAPGGKLLLEGDMCYRTKLADTLRQVSLHGSSILYAGPLAAELAKDVQSAGGILTAADLASYNATVREPIEVEGMGLTFIGAPPPSSGGATLAEVIHILEQFPLALAGSGPLGVHRTVEAVKFAFAARMRLGDSDFVDNARTLAEMLSLKTARQIRSSIVDSATFDPSYYGAKFAELADGGTTHFSIVDGDRNAVSMTSTINTGFGSKVLSPSTGILLNNEMADFSIPGESDVFGLPPAEANFIRAGKRPLSSMSPTIVLQDGQLRAVLGGSGGPYIITATIQVVLNYFARGLSPVESVVAPRFHHQLLPNTLFFESNHSLISGASVSFDPLTVAALQRRNHSITPVAYGGVVQLIVHDLEVPADVRVGYTAINSTPGVVYGRLTAVSDPRKDGEPEGWSSASWH